ncbi:DUF916 and DUF3324 domain-containing protein [Enterococcus sp. BWR-S5]|uniref:DUF916 and DUF3324 domain-containing protein n=1 Tax=Enterococcus sp. BWR-S5 TaxID=2787714 RepID=UPI002ED6FAC4
MKKIQQVVLGLLYIIMTALLVFPGAAAAEETETPEVTEVGGFTYEVILPENQLDKEVGYFDLQLAAGRKQTIQIKLTNPTNIETTLSVELSGAKTNSNGVIEYTSNEIENDASLKYDFMDVVKGPEEVVLAPGEERMLDLEVTMPEASFDGIITGGIQLRNITNEEELDKQKEGTVINKFAYLIGVVLQQTDTEVTHDLALNKVYAGLNNYRNTIFVNFSNIQPAFVAEMTVDAQITKKGSKDVLYDTKKASMKMAPNSLIDFPVSMQGDRMVAGDYTAYITVTTEVDTWTWEQDFTITNEEAEKYNEEDVGMIQETGIDWKLIAAIVAGVFVLVLIIYLVIRQVKKKKSTKKRKKTKTKKKKRN